MKKTLHKATTKIMELNIQLNQMLKNKIKKRV